jgi:hypothetical protein
LFSLKSLFNILKLFSDPHETLYTHQAGHFLATASYSFLVNGKTLPCFNPLGNPPAADLSHLGCKILDVSNGRYSV